MFKAVERNLSLTERTERQIEALIVDQSLRSGERLPPQDELAERLGVSRTVIREAVRYLIAKGLLEARKGSGVYVRPPGSGLQTGPPPPNRSAWSDAGLADDVPQVLAGPATKGVRLLPEERRRRILEMLDQSECVTVSDLVERLGVSRVTARADLDSLGAEGALVRSHGGALKPMDPRSDYPLQLKQTLHHAEKVRIASAAANLIHDGDTVAFDSGTTTCEVAKQIKRLNFRSLTVITNALNIANELSSLAWVSVIMTGGILRHKSGSFTGPHAHETLRDLNADHLFLGADAIDVVAGLTTPDILGAQVALRMIELAREVTVVVDASKFGRHSLTLSGKIEDLDRVITDARVSSAHVDSLRQHGIEVILV
jgi:DeoR family transcriptional regulator, aga operon transcriptional repressor